MRTESSKNSLDARALFGHFLNLLDDDDAEPFHQWVTNVILDGNLFSFDRHEYLREPYKETHPFQVHMKATQKGLTTYAMLRVLYSLQYLAFKGILYLFPSKNDVSDFSRARVTTLINENPDSIGKWLNHTDNIGLKSVGSGHLYLRGMVSRVGLKSVPADMVVFDELDEAREQSAVEMALERMAHSEFKEVLMLSNPTLPDYGIDKAFQETDQRYWLIKCDKCNKWVDMVESFPDCLVESKSGAIRACSCGAELNVDNGQWVAKKPSVTDRRGYQYSQLYSHYVEPAELLRKYRTATSMSNFYNLNLGLAYVEAENRLSVQEVLALCSDYGIQSEAKGPCFMGIDQGTDLHVVIIENHWQYAGKLVHLGVYKDWNELDPLLKKFSIARTVCDALPEQRNARAFAERHRGQVFLNFYNEHQKHHIKWDEKKLICQVNRTESLDYSHRLIQKSEVILPRECDIVREFAKHMHNTAKKLEEDQETGSKRYVYLKLGPDHFRHSWNYAAMALQSSAKGFFRGSVFKTI